MELEFNLLLLPLLGGFIFALRWYPTYVYTSRSDGHRLIFISATCGAFFLLSTAAAALILHQLPAAQGVVKWWSAVPHPPNLGKAVIAAVLASTIWIPLNFFSERTIKKLRPNYQKEFASTGQIRVHGFVRHFFIWSSSLVSLNRAINKKADPIELTLRDALHRTEMVSVTVESGRVYVGDIATLFNPAHEKESIEITLDCSGYRRDEDKRIILDIDYRRQRMEIILDTLIPDMWKLSLEDQELEHQELEQRISEKYSELADLFKVAVPFREIKSISFFSRDRYTPPRSHR